MIVSENGPKHAINKLPELLRRAVVQALFNEVPLREVAKMAGCSLGSVHRYKQEFIVPTLQSQRQNLIDQQVKSLPKLDVEEVKELRQEVALEQVERRGTKAVLGSSPVKRRAEKLWQFTRHNLQRAQKAQRTVTMPDGTLAPVGQDFAVLAPLLNQAHKNLEIQGKLSGELSSGDRGSPTVAIQIVMPAGPSVAQTAADGVVIDVPSGARIGVKNR